MKRLILSILLIPALLFGQTQLFGFDAGDGSAAVTTELLTTPVGRNAHSVAAVLDNVSCQSKTATQAVTISTAAGTALATLTCVLKASYSTATTDGTTGFISGASLTSTAIPAGSWIEMAGTGGTATEVQIFATAHWN